MKRLLPLSNFIKLEGANAHTMTLFLQELVVGLATCAIYALIALGYTMVYGIIELINFAHGDIFMMGSLISIATLGLFGITSTSQPRGLALVSLMVVACLGSMLICAVMGVVIERVAYRPLRNAPRLAPLISAIGVSLILQDVGQVWKGPGTIVFPDIFQDQIFKIAIGDRDLIIRSKAILTLVISVSIMILLTQFVRRTKLGKAMRATA